MRDGSCLPRTSSGNYPDWTIQTGYSLLLKPIQSLEHLILVIFHTSIVPNHPTWVSALNPLWSDELHDLPKTSSNSRKQIPCIILDGVSERTKLTLAALASAAMPNVPVTGARDCDQISQEDQSRGISCALIQDSTGNLYDVWAADTDSGKQRLDARVKAAKALEDAKEMGAMGFGVERILAYQPGLSQDSPTGMVSVAVMKHRPGRIRPLHLLTVNECNAAGTAIGAIHRVRSDFLEKHHYPTFTTAQIFSQLQGWIRRLRQDGHVPEEITDSWASIIETEGLWSFNTCTVHGGFANGDLLYSDSGLSAVYGWQDMQVNDPARDLAWIFAKLDGSRRNAVIASYGRMMGSRLDDLIMLRANLWLQMEQVGEFIRALDRADNEQIIQFKAQVERLAQELNDHEHHLHKSQGRTQASPDNGADPSTITVGTLLDGQNRSPHPPSVHQAGQPHKEDRTRTPLNPSDQDAGGNTRDSKEREKAQEESSATIAIERVDMVDLARTQTALSHETIRQMTESRSDQDKKEDSQGEGTSRRNPPESPLSRNSQEANPSKKDRQGAVSQSGFEKTSLPENPKSEESKPEKEAGSRSNDHNPHGEQDKEKKDSKGVIPTETETITLPHRPAPEETPTRTTNGFPQENSEDAQGVIPATSE